MAPSLPTLPSMSLVPLDVPNPATLNHRWAVIAAVLAGVGWGHDVQVDERGVRLHHDGGGNWVAMALLPQGRALLFGHDHEYSETYFREAAAYFEEPETDLLAGAPAWWGEALDSHVTSGVGEWVGFVYGWEAGRWHRASYPAADGFNAALLPPVTHERTVETITATLDFRGTSPAPGAVDRLVHAGPAVDEQLLADVTGPDLDHRAGAAAAARFMLP